MHTVFLHAWADILAQWCWIRVIDVSVRSGGHAGNFIAHIETCARKPVCMHIIFSRALDYISGCIHARTFKPGMKPL